MNRFRILSILFFLPVVLSCRETIHPRVVKPEKPDIFPDYTGVTIPATIAPLNFKVKENYSAIDAVIKGCHREVIHIRNKQSVSIPPEKWSKILLQNKGDSLCITVTLKQGENWVRYAPFAIYISNDKIDCTLAYRLIAPGYEVYSKMGIYQRDLSSFKQAAIIKNTLLPGSCVNCHSFRQSSPRDMSLHVRGKKGGTILLTDGRMNLLNTKTDSTMSNFVYPYWHPSGNYIAYSVNQTHQVFHSSKEERVEVIDLASDIVVYDVRKNQAIGCDRLMKKQVFETFPAFSADGKTLYFCAAESRKMPDDYQNVCYNLCSISFDPGTGTFGNQIDTLYHAVAKNKSVTFPRPSPDGKYIMFTLTDYGNFSIWHKEADLYLLDLHSGKVSPLNEVNSPDTESYHSWSSNSRWFVFSSRRIDGLYTHPYLAHIDENGSVSKPFLLPQKNPDFYRNLTESFNIPEFVKDKININISLFEKKALRGETKQVKFKKQ